MKRLTITLLVLSLAVAFCLAIDKKTEKDEDGKVEVAPDSKETKKGTNQQETDEEAALDEEQDDEAEDEEEEEDPNAKIEVEELYVPKGCKNKTKTGDQVVVHYTGWLDDGSLFDTTIDHRKHYQPFEFILGSGTVIKGFEKALVGMCKEQRRRVTIPPALAYGKKGTTDIPGNTTLTYDLELLDYRKPAPHHDMFSYMDKNGDNKLTRSEISNYMRVQAEARFAPVHDEQWQKQHEKMVDNVFAQEDTDGDGVISHEEFSGPKVPRQASHDEF